MKKLSLLLFVTFSLSAFVAKTQNVGIGTTTPNASAQLDVSATNKGMLLPQVYLTNVNQAAPVASPAIGLLLYNTNASVIGGNGIGFYFWSGTVWTKLVTTLPYINTDSTTFNNYSITTGTEIIPTALKNNGSSVQVLGNGDDIITTNLNLPFPLKLGQYTFTNFAVSSNGFMQLLLNPTSIPLGFSSLIANVNPPPAFIAMLAPLWDDLTLLNDPLNQGGVWVLTTGTTPNRQFSIEWIGAIFNSSTVNNLRFKIILSESDNQVKFQYSQVVPNAASSATVCISDGVNSNTQIHNTAGPNPAAASFYTWLSTYTALPFINVNGNIKINGLIETEALIAPTLVSGWSNYGNGFATVGYYKDKQNVVYLSGTLSGSSSFSIFQLPINYMPAGGRKIRFAVPQSNYNTAQVQIESDGYVAVYNLTGVSPWIISLDGISFKAN